VRFDLREAAVFVAEEVDVSLIADQRSDGLLAALT
jgi:hypothetical protein